jgi:hypothetical protein
MLVDFCVLPILADLGNCRFSQNQLELSQPNRAKLFKHQPLGSCHFLSLSLSPSPPIPLPLCLRLLTYLQEGRKRRKEEEEKAKERANEPQHHPQVIPLATKEERSAFLSCHRKEKKKQVRRRRPTPTKSPNSRS